MLKVRLLKYLDKFLGLPAVRLMPMPRPAQNSRNLDSILVIRPGGIGDAVLLVPAILALRKKYPQIRITILAERRNSAVFRLCPAVDEVLEYDRGNGVVKVLCRKFDAVIDTEQWHRLSAVIARSTGAFFLSGFSTNERRRLFNCPISYSHDTYEAFSFLNLLQPFAISEPAVLIPWLMVPEAAAKKRDELLTPLSGRRVVAIFPGATIPERRWGVARFKAVAEELDALQIGTVVVGGIEEVADGVRIVENCRGLNLAGKTSLVETAAVIEKSAALLTGDSGILHIGVGLGTPTVSLFGPGIVKKWAPRGGNHVVLNKNLPCSPCTTFGYTPRCPTLAQCLADITVDEVVAAVKKLLVKHKEH